jgi:hypothetical protein
MLNRWRHPAAIIASWPVYELVRLVLLAAAARIAAICSTIRAMCVARFSVPRKAIQAFLVCSK